MNVEKHIVANLLFYTQNYVHLPRLQAKWFTDSTYQVIIAGMQKLYCENKEFGLFEIKDEIGIEYARDLMLLSNQCEGDSNIERHIMLLQQEAKKRELFANLSKLDIVMPLTELTSKLSQYLDESMIVFAKNAKSINTVINSTFDNMEAAIKRGDRLSGLPTGWNKLDSVIGGWNKSDMVVIAGRPGSGKTAIALTFIRNAAKLGAKCLFLSLEMSSEQIAKRYMSLLHDVPSYKIRSGDLNNNDLTKLANSINIDDVVFYIDDEAIVDIQTIKSKVKIHRAKHGLDILVIDYLQLIKGNKQNREQEISDISRNLKVLAKELNITVIALAQLSRKCEERADKRPMLSDIRESGSIEQDADIILFPFRQNYYDRQQLDIEDSELIIAKNRHGEIGVFYTEFIPNRTFYRQKP